MCKLVLLAVLGVLRVMNGVMFCVMLCGMFVMFMRQHGVAMRQMGMVRGGVMVTRLVVGVGLTVMVSGGFVVESGVMMMVVFGHGFGVMIV